MTVKTYVPKHLPIAGGGRRMNPAYVALWESYLDEGMSVKDVAEMFGVAPATVSKHYPGKSWNAEQKLELSLAVRAHNRQMKKAVLQYA